MTEEKIVHLDNDLKIVVRLSRDHAKYMKPIEKNLLNTYFKLAETYNQQDSLYKTLLHAIKECDGNKHLKHANMSIGNIRQPEGDLIMFAPRHEIIKSSLLASIPVSGVPTTIPPANMP